MNRVISLTFALLLALLATGGAKAQSKEFEAGKNLHIYYNVLQMLQQGYVDSVSVDKLVKTSIDRMLASLDPYTEYLPDLVHPTEEGRFMIAGHIIEIIR